MTTPCPFVAVSEVLDTGRVSITYTPTRDTSPASDYGLLNYNIVNRRLSENPAVWSIEPNIANPAPGQTYPRVMVSLENGQYIATPLSTGIGLLVSTPLETNTLFSVLTAGKEVDTRSTLQQGVIWNFTFDNQGNVVALDPTGGDCPLVVFPRGLPPFTGPPPTAENSTTITVNASTTRDNKQLCQVDFFITDPEGRCKKSNATVQYRLYCIDLVHVLRGKGCTIATKAASLNVDFLLLLKYALIRLALSKLIFGCFQVQYLRQRYYEELLKEVARCYPNFIQFFDGSNAAFPFRNYFRYFKK